MAVKSTARMAQLVLANAVGIKVGGRETRDIVDIFAIPRRSSTSSPMPIRRSPRATTRPCRTRTCAPPRATARRPRAMPGRPTCTIPSSRAGCTASGFRRCSCGATADRILSEAYGRAYCAAIPGARFETDASAPAISRIIEQPDEFARRVHAFTRRTIVMRVYHFSEHPYPERLERSARLSARRPAEPGARSEDARPTCSTATGTNTCWPTSSAST